MFVRQSTHDRVVRDKIFERSQKESYRDMYLTLVLKWNHLVDKVNQAGGEKALMNQQSNPTQFSQEDIRRLLQLCHPDKHDGKQSAVEMTQKLNRMKI
jgi:hypothetical protein